MDDAYVICIEGSYLSLKPILEINKIMSGEDVKEIRDALISFREERQWKQFHNPKDLAVALSIEAAELNELFLWRTSDALDDVDQERIAEELADVFAYAFLMAVHYDFDVKKIILDKIKKNGEKYPVGKSLGRADKYSSL